MTRRWAESSGDTDRHRAAAPIARLAPRFGTVDRLAGSLTIDDGMFLVVCRVSCVASLAHTLHLENVVKHSETCLGAKVVDDGVEFELSGVGDIDVLDSATGDTNHMVVVPREPLGQLVSSDTIGSVMLLEYVSFLEGRERSIERGHGNSSSCVVSQFRGGSWTGGHLDRCNDGTSPRCVSDVVFGEPCLDELVDLGGGRRICHGVRLSGHSH